MSQPTLSECYYRVLEDLEFSHAEMGRFIKAVAMRAQNLAEADMLTKQQQAAIEKAIDEVVK
jgi:hypothetical protein